MNDIFQFLSQETTICAKDLLYFIPFTGLFIIYRLIVSNYILKPISKQLPEKTREKFIHRGFDCIHYITSTTIGTLAFLQRPYAHCPFYFCDCREFIGYTGPAAICSVFEKVYYFYFGAYYISDAFWISTTKDIKMLIVHHFLTGGMIVTLALVSRPVVTLSISLLHDWVDVFLYSGKIATYFQKQRLADFLLVLFALSFFYLRLFNCAAILFVGCTGEHPQPTHYYTYIISRVLFGFLYCCHLIWGYQIIKALQKVLLGAKVHDTRSDDEKAKKE